MEDRQRENDKFSKWQHDEDQFHLKQAHLRSNIRIVDGRAKPIDLLAKYISAEEGKFRKYVVSIAQGLLYSDGCNSQKYLHQDQADFNNATQTHLIFLKP